MNRKRSSTYSLDHSLYEILTCHPEYIALMGFDLMEKLHAPADRSQNRGMNSTGMSKPSVSHRLMRFLASAAVMLRAAARSGVGGQARTSTPAMAASHSSWYRWFVLNNTVDEVDNDEDIESERTLGGPIGSHEAADDEDGFGG